MTIRTFQAGDDLAQVSIYNEAAASLPKFKPATIDEVRRRNRSADFDPSARFYAIEDGMPVGYSSFQANGRINYPWCRKGKEHLADELLACVLATMKQRGLASAWAAYRGDWPTIQEYFLARGFHKARDIQNYILDLIEMPTPAGRVTANISPLTAEDIPLLQQSAPDLLRVPLTEIEKAWLHNSWFSPTSLFCLRSRTDHRPVALGALILNKTFADPKMVDSSMPCFRLGAFGTESLTAKRINGLFSFFVTEAKDTNLYGLELLGHAARLMQEIDGETVAAQVPSDVAHLARFYKSTFRLQGSFPIVERAL